MVSATKTAKQEGLMLMEWKEYYLMIWRLVQWQLKSARTIALAKGLPMLELRMAMNASVAMK